MEFLIENKLYNVKIIRKNNKKTYIRLNENEIIVTTNYFVTNKKIKKLLEENINFLIKRAKTFKKGFYLMGKEYEVIYDEKINKTYIDDNKIITKNEKSLLKFESEKVKEIFSNRLILNYNKFSENIPFPSLRVRKMKSKWGVCNIKNINITLNYNLINYDYDCLDYVIIHELSHLVHFNHSKKFWELVQKYEPNYKNIKKKLKSWQNI